MNKTFSFFRHHIYTYNKFIAVFILILNKPLIPNSFLNPCYTILLSQYQKTRAPTITSPYQSTTTSSFPLRPACATENLTCLSPATLAGKPTASAAFTLRPACATEYSACLSPATWVANRLPLLAFPCDPACQSQRPGWQSERPGQQSKQLSRQSERPGW